MVLMLGILAAIGGGLFIVASLIVGARLVWLARTTRGLPEFLLGTGLFFMGGVGYPLMMAAIQGTGLSDTTRMAFMCGHMTTTLCGMGGIAWFTYRVFHPHALWARVFWLGIIAMYGVLIVWQVTGPGLMAYVRDPLDNPWRFTAQAGIVVMSWAGVSSIHYWMLLRRRLKLGLADPVVTDRFRLWGVAILTADSISVVTLTFQAFGVNMTGTELGAVVVGSMGLVTASTLWLAFVPPRAYVDRIRRRAAA
jgi:hypothetical protein